MFVSISNVDTSHGHLVGGKALGLAKLLENGFRTPPGLVLSTAVFRTFLQQNNLWERANQGGDERLAEDISNACIDVRDFSALM